MSNTTEVTEQLPVGSTAATAAANTAVSIVLPAGTNVVKAITASVSVAVSGAVTLTVTDGATLVFSVDLALAVGTPYTQSFPAGGLLGTKGNTLTIALSAPVGTSVGKLNVVGGPAQ